MTDSKPKNPFQPLALDPHGVLRFKENAIVAYLLDNGGIDLNQIAIQDFSQDDRIQFAQLIGYSHSGFSELSYVSDAAVDATRLMYESGITETEARIAFLEDLFETLKVQLREPMGALFERHPDDFMELPALSQPKEVQG